MFMVNAKLYSSGIIFDGKGGGTKGHISPGVWSKFILKVCSCKQTCVQRILKKK